MPTRLLCFVMERLRGMCFCYFCCFVLRCVVFCCVFFCEIGHVLVPRLHAAMLGAPPGKEAAEDEITIEGVPPHDPSATMMVTTAIATTIISTLLLLLSAAAVYCSSLQPLCTAPLCSRCVLLLSAAAVYGCNS